VRPPQTAPAEQDLVSTTTEAERQERREADRRRAAEAVEALKSSEGWRSWLRARPKFHNYSFTNQLLIAMQHPEATYVTGFRKWLELGYCVRRGEKALYIWLPVPPSRKAIAAWEAAGAHGRDGRRGGLCRRRLRLQPGGEHVLRELLDGEMWTRCMDSQPPCRTCARPRSPASGRRESAASSTVFRAEHLGLGGTDDS
jgi:hypothetical protein